MAKREREPEQKPGCHFQKPGWKRDFREKKGTKTERKRGENMISGSKIPFQAGKLTRNRKRRPGLETGKAPVFLGTNPEQKAERKRGENGISGSKNQFKAGKGTGTKTGLPFSETGDKTGFLREKKGTKVERKRGENRISGSKFQFKTGKGTRNRKKFSLSVINN